MRYTATGTARGRIYLYHGLNSTPSQWAGSPYSDIVAGLRDDGWECFAVGELYDGAGQATSSQATFVGDATKGASFRSLVLALHDSTKAWIDYTYGPGPERDVLIGISWGGLMVELLVQSAREFRAWMAHLPATNPSVMTEFSGDDLSSLQPTTVIGPEPGWIAFGQLDTRVGYTDTQTLGNALHALNAAVDVIDYPTLDHSTTPAVVTDMLAWVAALP